MIRHAISKPETMSHHVIGVERRETEQQQAAIVELQKLIAEGKNSGIGTKSMAEIKAEIRAELGL